MVRGSFGDLRLAVTHERRGRQIHPSREKSRGRATDPLILSCLDPRSTLHRSTSIVSPSISGAPLGEVQLTSSTIVQAGSGVLRHRRVGAGEVNHAPALVLTAGRKDVLRSSKGAGSPGSSSRSGTCVRSHRALARFNYWVRASLSAGRAESRYRMSPLATLRELTSLVASMYYFLRETISGGRR